MNNFEQLMLQEQTSTLTLEEREFVEVHRQIVSCGEMTGRYFVEMCHKIKQMRDGKLFRAAGFETFGEYTETALKRWMRRPQGSAGKRLRRYCPHGRRT